MSENKKTIILAIALASILVILLGAVSLAFFPAQITRSASTPKAEPAPLGVPTGGPAIMAAQVFGTVELNSSQGFNSSIMASEAANSTLFVLPPGGSGSVPFLVYSSGTNETVNVSLSVNLGLQQAESFYGVQFTVSPSHFTLSLGQQITSVLTVSADQNAPSAFYLPTVQIQTNSSYIVGGTVNVPALLVANSTPSCLFLVYEQEFTTPISIAPFPPSVSGINAAAGSSPPTVSTPINNASISSPPPLPSPPGLSGLSVAPTINMVPGEKTTVLYACIAQDPLSLNATVPAGFSAEFSPNPTDIIFSYTSGNIYALTVAAGANISPGTYELSTTGSLGSYQFDASFNVVVK